MTRIIITFLFVLISLCAVQTSHAAEIIINSTGKHEEGGRSCAILNSISMTESGNVAWKFTRYNYSVCDSAKVNFAKTDPPKSIRGVFQLNKNGTFNNAFVIVATPKTTTIQC